MKVLHLLIGAAAAIVCASSLIASQQRIIEAAPLSSDDMMVLRGHTSGVTGVRFSPDSRWIVSSSLDGTVRLWSWPGGRSMRVLHGGGELYDVAVSRDGQLIVAVGVTRNVIVWRSATGGVARRLELPVRSLSLTFAGANGLAVGSSDGKIRLIDLGTGHVEREIQAGPEVFALAVSPDGRHLASGLPLAVWEYSTGKRIATPRGFAQGDVAFSNDGRWLASGEYTGGGRLFSVPSADLVSRLATNEEKRVQGPKGSSTVSVSMPVTSLAFSANGRLLATAGGDRKIQLWRISESGAGEKPETILQGHSMTVTGVSFAANGSFLASAGLDHTVRVWQVSTR